jgi:hypothetical protein
VVQKLRVNFIINEFKNNFFGFYQNQEDFGKALKKLAENEKLWKTILFDEPPIIFCMLGIFLFFSFCYRNNKNFS